MPSSLPVSPLSSQPDGDADTELARLPEPICPVALFPGLPLCEDDPGAARGPKNLVHGGNPYLLLVRYLYFTKMLETTALLCPIPTKMRLLGWLRFPGADTNAGSGSYRGDFDLFG